MALVKVKATRDGKSLEDNRVIVFHIENEKVTSAWLHGYYYQKTDEFWN